MKAKLKNYFDFSKRETLRKFAGELTPKDYYTTFLGMFLFAGFVAFFCQVASLASGFAYFSAIFKTNIKNEYLLIVATLGFGLIIELAKFFVVGTFFRQMYRLRAGVRNVPLGVLALVLSGLSIYASVIGGGSLGVDSAKIEGIAGDYDTRLAGLQGEIKAITDRNTWKGKVWLPKDEKALLHGKESELALLKKEKVDTLGKAHGENEKSEMLYRYWFAGFELVFLLCTYFGYYFKRRAVIEDKLLSTLEPNTPTGKIGFSQVPNSTIAPKQEGYKVGFRLGKKEAEKLDKEAENSELCKEDKPLTTIIVNENRKEGKEGIKEAGNRHCKHCGTLFVYKHHKQTYCGEKCRIQAWENRTGKTFYKKGGKV